MKGVVVGVEYDKGIPTLSIRLLHGNLKEIQFGGEVELKF
jgi:hypothetical protein